MGDNKKGSVKSVLVGLLVTGVIFFGIYFFMFYFFGLSLPMPTLFGWGSIHYECVPHECSELKEENVCNVAVTSQHRPCQWIENTCKKNECASYTTQTSCKNALLGLKCSWIEDSCRDSLCSNYKNEDSCNLGYGTASEGGCIWVVNHCKERKCSSFETEGLCQNVPEELNCKWSYFNKHCEKKTCYDYTDKETCKKDSFCKWEKNGIYNETCFWKRCEDHTEEFNCLRVPGGCNWYNNRCVKNNCGGSLYANEENCKSLYQEQGCTWDKEGGICLSPREDCNRYKNETICMILPFCSWSEELDECIAKKTKECRKYKYDYTACIDETDDLECAWKDNDFGSPCIEKNCWDYNQKKSCLTTPRELNCDWVGNKCRPRGEFLCRELKSLQCNNHPLCKWQKDYSFPSPGLKMF